MSPRLSRAEQNDRNRALLFAAARRVFLALLADRIEERAAENAKAAGPLTGSGNFAVLLDLAQQSERAAPGWRLLVTEFRIHAARDPELSRRFAALHARTVEGLAGVLVSISPQGEETLAFPSRQLAELLLAIEAGLALEQLASPDAFGGPRLPVLGRLNSWLAKSQEAR